MRRYVLEGAWGGYRPEQAHICHRQVISAGMAKEIQEQALSQIIFTDGTRLYLRVRPALFKERVKELNGYAGLIEDCLRFRVSSVEALQYARKRG